MIVEKMKVFFLVFLAGYCLYNFFTGLFMKSRSKKEIAAFEAILELMRDTKVSVEDKWNILNIEMIVTKENISDEKIMITIDKKTKDVSLHASEQIYTNILTLTDEQYDELTEILKKYTKI